MSEPLPLGGGERLEIWGISTPWDTFTLIEGKVTVTPIGGGGGGSAPPSPVAVEVHPDYTGLRVVYGPGPLPPAGANPNTIYFLLPDRTP